MGLDLESTENLQSSAEDRYAAADGNAANGRAKLSPKRKWFQDKTVKLEKTKDLYA